MKTLFVFLFLLTTLFTASAQSNTSQPLDVLIIGTSHNYNPKYNETFSYAIDKAAAFRPDAVFGEFMSAADYDAVPDYWNKANVEKRVANVKSYPFADPKNPDRFIRQAYRNLREHPNFHQERMKLARALYLKHDFGNAQYQLYQLDKSRSAFGPEERDAYRAILGEPDSLYRRRTDEYHNIIFPLMDQLKQDHILPMDCQQYDLLYSAANQKAWTAFTSFDEKMDTTSADYTQIKDTFSRLVALQKKDREAAKMGQLMAFVNSPDYDEMAYMDDGFGGKSLYDLKGYPKAEVLNKEKYWLLRNECMSHNIVDRARAAGAKRVVVAVGASHRKPLMDMLRAMPGVTVYTLNEYQP